MDSISSMSESPAPQRRPRHGRVPSREIRPLLLVERHLAKAEGEEQQQHQQLLEDLTSCEPVGSEQEPTPRTREPWGGSHRRSMSFGEERGIRAKKALHYEFHSPSELLEDPWDLFESTKAPISAPRSSKPAPLPNSGRDKYQEEELDIHNLPPLPNSTPSSPVEQRDSNREVGRNKRSSSFYTATAAPLPSGGGWKDDDPWIDFDPNNLPPLPDSRSPSLPSSPVEKRTSNKKSGSTKRGYPEAVPFTSSGSLRDDDYEREFDPKNLPPLPNSSPSSPIQEHFRTTKRSQAPSKSDQQQPRHPIPDSLSSSWDRIDEVDVRDSEMASIGAGVAGAAGATTSSGPSKRGLSKESRKGTIAPSGGYRVRFPGEYEEVKFDTDSVLSTRLRMLKEETPPPSDFEVHLPGEFDKCKDDESLVFRRSVLDREEGGVATPDMHLPGAYQPSEIAERQEVSDLRRGALERSREQFMEAARNRNAYPIGVTTAPVPSGRGLERDAPPAGEDILNQEPATQSLSRKKDKKKDRKEKKKQKEQALFEREHQEEPPGSFEGERIPSPAGKEKELSSGVYAGPGELESSWGRNREIDVPDLAERAREERVPAVTEAEAEAEMEAENQPTKKSSKKEKKEKRAKRKALQQDEPEPPALQDPVQMADKNGGDDTMDTRGLVEDANLQQGANETEEQEQVPMTAAQRKKAKKEKKEQKKKKKQLTAFSYDSPGEGEEDSGMQQKAVESRDYDDDDDDDGQEDSAISDYPVSKTSAHGVATAQSSGGFVALEDETTARKGMEESNGINAPGSSRKMSKKEKKEQKKKKRLSLAYGEEEEEQMASNENVPCAEGEAHQTDALEGRATETSRGRQKAAVDYEGLGEAWGHYEQDDAQRERKQSSEDYELSDSVRQSTREVTAPVPFTPGISTEEETMESSTRAVGEEAENRKELGEESVPAPLSKKDKKKLKKAKKMSKTVEQEEEEDNDGERNEASQTRENILNAPSPTDAEPQPHSEREATATGETMFSGGTAAEYYDANTAFGPNPPEDMRKRRRHLSPSPSEYGLASAHPEHDEQEEHAHTTAVDEKDARSSRREEVPPVKSRNLPPTDVEEKGTESTELPSPQQQKRQSVFGGPFGDVEPISPPRTPSMIGPPRKARTVPSTGRESLQVSKTRGQHEEIPPQLPEKQRSGGEPRTTNQRRQNIAKAQPPPLLMDDDDDETEDVPSSSRDPVIVDKGKRPIRGDMTEVYVSSSTSMLSFILTLTCSSGRRHGESHPFNGHQCDRRAYRGVGACIIFKNSRSNWTSSLQKTAR